MNRTFTRLLALCGLVYFAFMLMVYLRQGDMVFLPDLPTRQIIQTPAALGLAYEDLYLPTPDAQTLHAWFVPHTASRHVVLFMHGNAGNISHRLDTISRLHELGLNILLLDYRGYGQSSGQISEAGTYTDADTAWHYLHAVRGYRDTRIIVHGRSLGGAVAADLATRVTPAAVVLESTFISVPAMGAELYPWLPVDWLARIRYDNLAKVPEIRSPLLIFHSPEDEIIPFRHGQVLFAAARAPKQFVRLQADHNHGFRLSPDYVPALRRFLLQHVPAYAQEQHARAHRESEQNTQ